MHMPHYVKAGMVAIVLVVLSVAGWEMYLRDKGFEPCYDDGNSLWADKRAQVYEPADKSTVFIGSSRIKFDLDIDTWQGITGNNAIQLAIEGNSPRPVLDDLANDKNFKGRVVVDVTEGLFFSLSKFNIIQPLEHIEYYKKRTPTQLFSFQLNRAVEKQFVFLDKDNFSLNALLDKLRIPNRPGVFTMPIFPPEVGRTSFERQNIMMDTFLVDTNLQNQVKNIWVFFDKINEEKPVSGKNLEAILESVKASVDKIRARGGDVLFVRTPSSGPYLAGENIAFPRAVYWDRLLSYTKCKGIHFADYPSIAHFQCPEHSHLGRPDAVVFTKNFINIIQEKGWKL